MKFLLRVMLVGLVALPAWCTTAQATYWVAGSFQDQDGGGGEWDPPSGPAMVETFLGSNIYTLDLLNLSGAGLGSSFEFKILDDGGTPPANWGDPEIPGPNSWFHTDASGSATITLDRNTYNDGFAPTTDRIIVSTDQVAVANFHAVGNWMDDSGFGDDWDPGEPTAIMNHVGGGLYSLFITPSNPGTYEYKATRGDWGGQIGTSPRSVDAGTWLFTTTAAKPHAILLLDVTKGAISVQVVPEPASVALAGIALVAFCGTARRRK